MEASAARDVFTPPQRLRFKVHLKQQFFYQGWSKQQMVGHFPEGDCCL